MVGERRKYVRFKVQNGAFACLSRRYNVTGRILNISEGGLAFRYIADKKQTADSRLLDISVTDGFRSLVIPFKSIWDCKKPGSYELGNTTARFCGVRFDNLSDEKKADLAYFIKNYTSPQEAAQSTGTPR